mmetsp:Transcript_36740/g.83805  ORF Transcript_36740/g.83805 Transcript_36740/m.83805 type:complete len:131 (-) Transcript_36740:1451-1843(-)
MDVDNTHDKVADEKVVDGGAGFAQTETGNDGGDVFNFEAWQTDTSTEVPPRDDEEEDEHSIAGHWLDETEEPEVDAPEPVPPRGTMTQGAPQEEEEEEVRRMMIVAQAKRLKPRLSLSSKSRNPFFARRR